MTISSNLLAISSENGERLRLSFGTKIGNPGFNLEVLGDVTGEGLDAALWKRKEIIDRGSTRSSILTGFYFV